MSRQYVGVCSEQPQEVLYPFLRKESVIAVKDSSLRPSKKAGSISHRQKGIQICHINELLWIFGSAVQGRLAFNRAATFHMSETVWRRSWSVQCSAAPLTAGWTNTFHSCKEQMLHHSVWLWKIEIIGLCANILLWLLLPHDLNTLSYPYCLLWNGNNNPLTQHNRLCWSKRHQERTGKHRKLFLGQFNC